MRHFILTVRNFILLLCLAGLAGAPAYAAPGAETAASPGTSQEPGVALTVAEQTFLQDHPQIRIGVNEDWEPYVIRRPDGTLEGFEVDLLKEISIETGANLQLVAGRWKELVAAAEGRQLDGLAMTVTSPSRAEHFLFSKSYLSVYPAIVVAADNPRSVDEIDDFRGETVAILAGHQFYRNWLAAHPGITVIEEPTETEVIGRVLEGKAAAAIISATSFDKHFKAFARSIRMAYVATDKPLDLLYSIRKDWPELVGILDKGLAALPAERFNELYYKWFGAPPPIVNSPSRPLQFSPEEKAWLAQQHRVRVHVGDYLPYYTYSSGQGVRGMAIDYLHLLAERSGLTLEFVTDLTWSEALLDIHNPRRIDLLPAAYVTPERHAFLNFTTEYLKSPSVILVRQDSPFVGSMKDLAGKTVAVEQDYATGKWLAERFPAVRLTFRATTPAALLAVANGEADAYIGNLVASTYIARSNGLANLMVAAPSPFGSDNSAMAVRKDWPELVGILDKALATVTPEEHEVIRARWLPPVRFEYGISHGDVLQVVGIVASGLLAIIGVILVWNKKLGREVVARTAAEAALRQSEESLRKALNFTEILLDRSPMGIRVFDGETGACRMANRVAAEIAGGPVESLQQQNFRELQSWQRAGLTPVAEAVLADGEARQVESTMTTSFGRSLSTRYFFARFYAEGRAHLMTIGQDISEEKRLASEKRQIEEQMLHVQKLESLGVLAGGIAHDFNNILMAVIGNADLALRRLAPDHPVVRHLQQIQAASSNASNLAGQMLAYSGKGRFVIESLDLNQVIADMLPMLEVAIAKKVRLRFAPGTSVPRIEADATQLRQVIMNLVINAAEAYGEEPGVIAVATGAMDCDHNCLLGAWVDDGLQEGCYVYLEVADSGCGMDEATLQRIYDPFFSTKFTGRGLGMAAVLGIVRGHKGLIQVHSEPGAGTTFRVLLPALAGAAADPPAAEPADATWRGRGRVLLVDDEEMVRAVGKAMLEELGFAVLTAANGVEAVALFRDHHASIDWVIMDLTMPEMAGDEAFREMQRLDPEVRVIITSGYNEQEIASLFSEKSLAGFIQKPFSLAALQQALQGAGG